MIVALEDDNCLHVYASLAEVTRAVEALDADDTLRAVFDDRGQRYRIEWVRPNERGWLGVTNGEYRLVVDGSPAIDELAALIADHRPVDPAAARALAALGR